MQILSMDHYDEETRRLLWFVELATIFHSAIVIQIKQTRYEERGDTTLKAYIDKIVRLA